MQIALDQEQVLAIENLVCAAVKNGIKQATNQKPYLNRRNIAKYFGIADSTISYWATLGMPVAIIDGRKMYGKKSITDWLKAHEHSTSSNSKPQKKPNTTAMVIG
ncbi:MAG: DNA-binding protein [Lactobacillus sp.]|jgi:hypothetical protein|nr:DNA-binding protein [Lactobacillus sp.]